MTSAQDQVQRVVAIVVAPYHEGVKTMIGVVSALLHEKLPNHICEVLEVPGAWEIPLAARIQCGRGEVDAVVTLGAIERGETGHGVALAQAVFLTLSQLSVQFSKPVTLGIIGPNATREQIASRVGPVATQAALAAVAMLKISERQS